MDPRSEKNLRGVDARLVRIVRAAHAAMEQDSNGLSFIVTEGVRTEEEQKELVKAGASQTMNSYHLSGKAVDIAVTMKGKVQWHWMLYPKVARRFKAAAEELGYIITWGGDWKKYRDGPHFQIEEWQRT